MIYRFKNPLDQDVFRAIELVQKGSITKLSYRSMSANARRYNCDYLLTLQLNSEFLARGDTADVVWFTELDRTHGACK